LLKTRLDKEGIKTRIRTSKTGQQTGGKFFSRGHLYQLLANVVYVGKVKHKDNIYGGEHTPIIDEKLWNKAQDQLKTNTPKRVRKINVKSGSLLTGILYDSTGDRLTPIHTKKCGRRYRYYVSNRLTKGELDDGKALRLPAENLEKQIQKCIGSLLSSTSGLADNILPNTHSTDAYPELEKQAQLIQEELASQVPEQKRQAILQLIKRIDIKSGELEIAINTPAFKIGRENDEPFIINYPYQLRRRGIETKLVIGGQAVGELDQGLIDVIAKARKWYAGFKSGAYLSIKDLSEKENVDRGNVSRILPLAFLAPTIIRDILQGKHPADMTPDSLQRSTPNLPMDWDEQKIYLGFA